MRRATDSPYLWQRQDRGSRDIRVPSVITNAREKMHVLRVDRCLGTAHGRIIIGLKLNDFHRHLGRRDPHASFCELLLTWPDAHARDHLRAFVTSSSPRAH
jgi:hypothetical protein